MTTDKVAITIDRQVLKRLDQLVAEKRFSQIAVAPFKRPSKRS